MELASMVRASSPTNCLGALEYHRYEFLRQGAADQEGKALVAYLVFPEHLCMRLCSAG